MSICYSDEKTPFTGSLDTAKVDAVKGYLTHYGNLLYLTFIANHASTSTIEKAQAPQRAGDLRAEAEMVAKPAQIRPKTGVGGHRGAKARLGEIWKWLNR